MSAVITIISLAFQVYEFLILIRVLLSWVRINPYHPAVQILHQITDPVLEPLRRLIPPIGGAIDISPVVALILLEILHRIVITVVAGL
jgi:YggT family protein